ncbi:MAG: hypothetical protein LPJ89_01905 [Hymenobacteraceae bacterium]|nr:hypothetical protein [Hymenobacteraceae bacterium]MDX5394720.1 hypothetical protein [Hymenobacteraceae bacterium]MDX5442517.1 hypothetical protein [Hymenobacteraceae bacterium]MDX5510753.1 hypothetical protein [Hymenobacteraceae bacterium]
MKNLFKFSFIVLGFAAFTACNSAENTAAETDAAATETVETAPVEEVTPVEETTVDTAAAPVDSVIAE